MEKPLQGPGRPTLPDDKKASSQMQLRISRSRKAAYVKAAQSMGQTLAAWSFEKLDSASGYAGE